MHVCRNCRLKTEKCNHSVLSVECYRFMQMLQRKKDNISNNNAIFTLSVSSLLMYGQRFSNVYYMYPIIYCLRDEQ